MFLILKPGEVFSIPSGPVRIERSTKVGESGEHAKTPNLLRLLPDLEGNEPNQFRLAFQGDEGLNGGKGKALFVPENLKPGDRLQIAWVDTRSACALPVGSIPPPMLP
ncbi:MAG: hypothetical protein A2744_03960 [Candidatus Buchananbacteria bacterium RIFCSPHIGHO2_01_FULL_44_11]|uniref:Uncharacterized protein n=1 Tax=Candidatus Buchananbacteria bacterium RIFCSPHIGHO2_01_FULL_44_11 TaxID=1797535 RepID=A0A1G1Y1E7_9BACT|nr:MAG: hypothetical protein A2744_03960 [Candidatus Buchananbacteria bacterium RIFCSPHIGHO2_01_FULL_44_11]